MGAALPVGGVGTLVLALVIYFLGGDPSVVIQQPGAGGGSGTQMTRQTNAEEDQLKQFVSVVLGDTEDVWHALLQRQGKQYREPKLVLFTGRVNSACGTTSSASGPFYCPEDEKLYNDLSFYREMRNKLGAPGDFAQAYVIAHEVGHHVQNLLGTLPKVHSLQNRVSKSEANQLSVRLELQADFYAGVWAHYAKKRNILDPGDIEEALNAASAIGDDRLQEQAQGYVVPDSFTHGSSAQRYEWFRRGYESGDLREGNTFE
jgi:predicted metalloprotease